jgi:hypothetical protein
MPDDFFYRPDLVSGLSWASPDIRPLTQLAGGPQQPATKQPATTGPPGSIDPNVLKTFGGELGKIIQQYRNQVQRYGGGQPQQGVAGQPGPIATPPTPGPPLNILPRQLRPQQSTTPDAYFPNVTGSVF